jgi:hypothetical protein
MNTFFVDIAEHLLTDIFFCNLLKYFVYLLMKSSGISGILLVFLILERKCRS